jgi:anaerobic dimethyl sulfoxide reductase subunit B (iron-sulfur subunit)
MAKQLAFFFDAEACTHCKACEIACQDRHGLGPEILWRRVFQYAGGDWLPVRGLTNVMRPSNVFSYSISTSCQHCQRPIVDICPVAAIDKRDDGIITIDDEKCIGCRYCEWACPYGAPQFDEATGVMTKCDFCHDLIDAGGNPACVDACVMRAIEFGELDDLRAKYGNVDALEPLPGASITEPALVVNPHPDAQRSGRGRAEIINLPEEV